MARIGLMGCGVVADYGHVPAILSTDGLELVALFDPDAERLQAMQQKFAVPADYTDTADFFATPLDAVVVTSPAPFHLQNIRDAARAGVHILCEKPLAMTVDEIEAMIDCTTQAGVQLFTAFDYRFSPVSQQIRQLLAEGAIGTVRSLRLIYVWNLHGKYTTLPDGRRVTSPRRDGRMAEGGPMVDCGVHQIDLARYWMGEVDRWSVAGAWVDEYEAPDHMYLHLDHTGGAHTMVEISFSYCHTAVEPISHFTYQLIGTEGLIRFDREAGIFEVRSSIGTRQLPTAGEKNFAGMYQAFSHFLATGDPGALPTAHDGLQATRLARSATDTLIAQRHAVV